MLVRNMRGPTRIGLTITSSYYHSRRDFHQLFGCQHRRSTATMLDSRTQMARTKSRLTTTNRYFDVCRITHFRPITGRGHPSTSSLAPRRSVDSARGSSPHRSRSPNVSATDNRSRPPLSGSNSTTNALGTHRRCFSNPSQPPPSVYSTAIPLFAERLGGDQYENGRTIESRAKARRGSRTKGVCGSTP